jgi:heme/copper-type cytochrome/quinol oxidase subunit 3
MTSNASKRWKVSGIGLIVLIGAIVLAMYNMRDVIGAHYFPNSDLAPLQRLRSSYIWTFILLVPVITLMQVVAAPRRFVSTVWLDWLGFTVLALVGFLVAYARLS